MTAGWLRLSPSNAIVGSRHEFVACLNHHVVHMTTPRSVPATVPRPRLRQADTPLYVVSPSDARRGHMQRSLSLSHLSITVIGSNYYLCPAAKFCVLSIIIRSSCMFAYTTNRECTRLCVYVCSKCVCVRAKYGTTVCCASTTEA